MTSRWYLLAVVLYGQGTTLLITAANGCQGSSHPLDVGLALLLFGTLFLIGGLTERPDKK